jgi:nicotinate-nucleotide adenylyltransferase
MRIGILGGTFDPIHVGHLIAGSEVYTALNLDTVVFMPAGHPWQKDEHKISSAQDRFEMVKRAVAADNRFTVSDLEIKRSGPTYAIDSVEIWQKENPNHEIFWIVGADALLGMTTWHRWEEFLELVTVVSVNRPGLDHTEVPFDFLSVQMPEVRISATQLRQRFGQGIECKYLVPDSVIDYIFVENLYKQ